ncbi:unnamed protein product [Calypogeia fissa]
MGGNSNQDFETTFLNCINDGRTTTMLKAHHSRNGPEPKRKRRAAYQHSNPLSELFVALRHKFDPLEIFYPL